MADLFQVYVKLFYITLTIALLLKMIFVQAVTTYPF